MTSYRVSDLGLARSEDVTEQTIEGRTVWVVEVLSPKDESYEKPPLHRLREVAVGNLLCVQPATRAFEVRRPDAAGCCPVAADDDGWPSPGSLGLALRTAGGRLQVRTDGDVEGV